MTAALRSDGFARQPGHNQVARVMRKFGCNAVTRRKNTYKVCVKKGVLPDGTVLKNRLNRQFKQKDIGKTFVTDVTYIPVKEGWLYVSPVMDLCSHEIVVCEMSLHQDMALGLKTLESLRKVIHGPVMLHSDQGTLYTNTSFRAYAAKCGIKQSYSRKGNCWNNAMMENWNGILKTEWLYHPSHRYDRHPLSAIEAMNEIKEYCTYYNTNRIQAKLDYRSPQQFKEEKLGLSLAGC